MLGRSGRYDRFVAEASVLKRFESVKGSGFRIVTEQGEIELKLVEIKIREQESAGDGVASFPSSWTGKARASAATMMRESGPIASSPVLDRACTEIEADSHASPQIDQSSGLRRSRRERKLEKAEPSS